MLMFRFGIIEPSKYYARSLMTLDAKNQLACTPVSLSCFQFQSDSIGAEVL